MKPAHSIPVFALFNAVTLAIGSMWFMGLRQAGNAPAIRSMWVAGTCAERRDSCAVRDPVTSRTVHVQCTRGEPCHNNYDRCRSNRAMTQAECSLLQDAGCDGSQTSLMDPDFDDVEALQK